jgi:rhamnosyltransferase
VVTSSGTAWPTVSVVIPTKNAGEQFRGVLARLRAQIYPEPVDILVIDSGSTDRTMDHAREFGAKVESIDPEDFNHGLTRNAAIEQTAGDVVVLITQDALPADAKLIESFARAYADPLVAGVYARQVPRAEADVLTARHLNRWLTGRVARDVKQITDRAAFDALPPYERYLFCNFDNVCASVRRMAWRRIPFRASDFGEDLDWSKRILETGLKIVYEPAAAVIHSHRRPVCYEYRRTYMCHRKLYELFGLATVPSRRHLVRFVIQATLKDLAYVARHEPDPGTKVGLMARVPALAAASLFGQYRGTRDERLGRGRKQVGV